VHPVLWIMVRIFTKISAPCFMDYGAYIYKNQCTLFYGLWCVYLQNSVHPVLWIMVRIFTKISAPWAPCFLDTVRIFKKISAPCFLDYGAYISLVTLPCIISSSRYNVSSRGVSLLTDGFIIATFSLAEVMVGWRTSYITFHTFP
jgi:hypothetical protein